MTLVMGSSQVFSAKALSNADVRRWAGVVLLGFGAVLEPMVTHARGTEVNPFSPPATELEELVVAYGAELEPVSAVSDSSSSEQVAPTSPEANLSAHDTGAAAPTGNKQPSNSACCSQPKPSWVDSGHGYVTERADNLTQWFDNSFGDAESDVEVASSRLRLRLINDWDERYGNTVRVRLGGKVNLPQISKRLDLVFRGDDPADDINGQQDPSQSEIGLQYLLSGADSDKHRFDLTIGASSSGPKPGMKYRYKTELSSRDHLRFTQRLQYEFDDGAYTTSRLDVDHQLTDRQLLRSYTRVLYGEASDGVEWSTAVQWIRFWPGSSVSEQEVMPQALILYSEVSGVTEPYQYVSNYRLGARFRKQTYRDYLFLELEPSYNWRIDEPYFPRRGAWKVELRAEFLLFNDLREDD